MWSFSINTCTVFNPHLKVHECERPTIYIDQYHLTYGTWASMDFGVCTRSWNQYPKDTEEQLSFWGSQLLYLNFQLFRGWLPNPSIILDSTVIAKKNSESIKFKDISHCTCIYWTDYNVVEKGNMVNWFNYMKRFLYYIVQLKKKRFKRSTWNSLIF